MASFFSDERGVSTVWSIFWSVIFLILAGVVIDTSYGYRAKSVLTATADSSALAAIRGFRDEGSYGLWVYGDREYFISKGNIAPSGDSRADELAVAVSDTIVAPQDSVSVTDAAMVTVGNWDEEKREYVAGKSPYNAALSKAVQTESNGNPLRTLLLGALTPFRQWDVGATAVAYAYKADCPSREGLMAGGGLQIASNNVWQGDLCLFGEDYVDMNNDNDFFLNDDGEIPGLAFGQAGAICRGFDDCQTDGFTNVLVPDNDNLEYDMINKAKDWMPDVHQMISDIEEAIMNPAKYAGADSALNQYIPDPLVTNPLREDGVAAELVSPDAPEIGVLPPAANAYFQNGALYINISNTDFEKMVNDASGTGANPLPTNAVYLIEGGCNSGNRRLELNSDIEIEDIQIYTSCRIMMDGNLVMTNVDLFSTYDGNNAAISGSSSVKIGGGTCSDPVDGSVIVAKTGQIDFAAKLTIENSQIITGGDIDVAAKPNGMEGTNIFAAGDIRVTSNGAFQGCPDGVFNKRVPYSYRLVQ